MGAKKEQDLDRCKKRLKDLENVRPAFMDEFEKLEKELEKIYGSYVEKFRNVEYLEHQLEQYNQAEQEKLEESERNLKRMQKRLKEEELRILRGEQEGDLGDDDIGRQTKGSGGAAVKSNEVYGSLSGGSDSESDMSEVLESDNSGVLSSGGASDDLIDDDTDQDDDDLSDVISGDSGSRSSFSDMSD